MASKTKTRGQITYAATDYHCSACGAVVAYEGDRPDDCLVCNTPLPKEDNKMETLDSLHGAAQAEFCLRVKAECRLAVAEEILRSHGLDDEYEDALALDHAAPCSMCGQTDQGQTGEYPCPTCGLPTTWDEKVKHG